MSKAFARTSSNDADLGTDAHTFVADRTLDGKPPADFLGLVLPNGNKVDEEMVAAAGVYVDYVRSIAGQLFIEYKLDISSITGEDDAVGTSDCVILTADEIVIVDFKYGKGVRVDAEGNPQLMIYALAALYEFGHLDDFKRARLVIVQPRINHISEWTIAI